jgi:hypothetical protein
MMQHSFLLYLYLVLYILILFVLTWNNSISCNFCIYRPLQTPTKIHEWDQMLCKSKLLHVIFVLIVIWCEPRLQCDFFDQIPLKRESYEVDICRNYMIYYCFRLTQRVSKYRGLSRDKEKSHWSRGSHQITISTKITWRSLLLQSIWSHSWIFVGVCNVWFIPVIHLI